MPLFDKSQLLRGSLEGCILNIIAAKTTYGYEILEILKTSGFKDLSEGTIYPILIRLEKQGSITSTLMPSPLGPKRKYYTITKDGKEYLMQFTENWKHISSVVGSILEESEGKS